METLEERIGYSFRDKSLLRTALTHTSYANERKDPAVLSYERLEFLGDSILGYVTAEFLYRHEPQIPEGRMTRLRAELVCEVSLHKIALRLGIGQYMRLGHGEEKNGGRSRVSVLADMVESIIAAMYLDGGLEPAKAFIYRELLDGAEIAEDHKAIDYKTELQEFVQRDGPCKIIYEETGESGPDHKKVFSFRVLVNGDELGNGTGGSKQQAEQAAAGEALQKLKA